MKNGNLPVQFMSLQGNFIFLIPLKKEIFQQKTYQEEKKKTP